ncbi:hypothetical protein E2562_014721 [Oryza meyeriana var. granulata]|uniref:Integrase catalytic domain-containing protein n=1 Tax=Oryza meyeriana var. granulata TaxID=110450 RepID=A0A6G1BL58_9ORYZ|nr:hypothetical protein E2562_014721 [Oryza meyeriana var. granulata]
MVWANIGLDFVEALPKVGGKSVILTVVDRFSKYCHFIPLAHPYTAETVAQAFFNDIVRLHGISQSMVSDRDPVFTSKFWSELMCLSGAKLHMTSAFHPQSDGQTEATNKRSGHKLFKDQGSRDLRTFWSGGGTSNLFAGDGGATNLPDVEVEIKEHDDFDSDEFEQAIAVIDIHHYSR